MTAGAKNAFRLVTRPTAPLLSLKLRTSRLVLKCMELQVVSMEPQERSYSGTFASPYLLVMVPTLLASTSRSWLEL